MNLHAIKPQNIIAAAALLAPIVLVQTVRMVFGGGTGHASAMTTSAEPPAQTAPGIAAAAPTPTVTAAQKTAIAHLQQQRGEITIFTSPFNHLAPKTIAVQPTPSNVTAEPTEAKPIPVNIPSEVKALALGALMRNEHGAYAVISGRVRSIGEVIVPGWTVTAIDPTERRVTLTGDDGTVVTLSHNQ